MVVTHRQPGCLAYEMSHEIEKPDNHVVRIEWCSRQEDEQEFRKKGRFEPFLAAMKPFFEQLDEMCRYQRTAIVSAA